jgi:hypothetical protein
LRIEAYFQQVRDIIEDNVVASPAPDLDAVISEVEALVRLP